jgi:hypothetical protein
MSLVTGFWREICVPLHSAVSPPTILQERKPSFTQHWTPILSGPTSAATSQQRLGPTPAPPPPETRPRLLSLSSRDLPQKMSGPKPEPSRPSEVRPSPLQGFPHTHSILSYLRVVPAVAAGPASERTLQNGDGRSSLGATGRFLARQLTHARVRAACLPSPSQERGDQSCGRTQLSAPRAGAGSCGDGTAERRSARPQPGLANHRLGSGSRLARQGGSGSNHCLGKTVRPGGVSKHHNGSWYWAHCRGG